MSVHVVTGDLLESECQTLVNTVNTVGVMGKGIAATFKSRFPDMYADYRRRCEITDPLDPRKVVLGRPYLYRPDPRQLSIGEETSAPKQIVNFPTKEHWRGKSSLGAIITGLDVLANKFEEWQIESIAVPPLGCGHGGLEWRVVGPELYARLSRLPVFVELYAPMGTPPRELDVEFLSRSSGQPVGEARHLDVLEAALAHLVGDIAESGEAGRLSRSDLKAITYWLIRAGIRGGGEISWDTGGLRIESFSRALSRLLRNASIAEAEVGRFTYYRAGATLDNVRRLFADDLRENAKAVELARGAFLGTRRHSRIAPTIHFLRTARRLEASAIVESMISEGRRRNTENVARDVDQVLSTLENLPLSSE